MKQVLSRKFKVLLLSLGNFLTTISSLVLTISLTRIFSMEQYASYKQTILIYIIVAPVLILGVDKAIYFFFSKSDVNKKNDYFNLQLFLFCISILYILFFILGGDKFISLQFNNPSIQEYLLIYSMMSLLEIPVKLLNPILIITEKVKTLTLFNIFYRVLFLTTSLIIAYYFNNVKYLLIAQLIVATLAFIFSQKIILNVLPSSKIRFDISVIKKYLLIGIPLSIATILSFLGKNIDKALISYYLTPKDYAIYVNGAIEIPFIGSVTVAVMSILLADFSKLYHENKIEELFQLWAKAIKFTSSILIILMFFLLLNADYLINIMYGIEYKESAKPFIIYLLLLPVRTMIFGSLITATGKTKVITYGAILFLISNVILSILLMKLLGFIGPAIATVITTYLLAFYYSCKIKRQYNVSFFDVYDIKQQKNYFIIGVIAYVFSLYSAKIVQVTYISSVLLTNLIFVFTSLMLIVFLHEYKTYFEIINIFKKKKIK